MCVCERKISGKVDKPTLTTDSTKIFRLYFKKSMNEILDIPSQLVKSLMKHDTLDNDSSLPCPPRRCPYVYCHTHNSCRHHSISPFLSFLSLLLMTPPSYYFYIYLSISSNAEPMKTSSFWRSLYSEEIFYFYVYLSISSNAELWKTLSFWRSLF